MSRVRVPVVVELTVPSVYQQPKDGRFWGIARFAEDGDFETWKSKEMWTLIVQPAGPLAQGQPCPGEAEFAHAEAPSHLLRPGVRVEIWKPWICIAVVTVA